MLLIHSAGRAALATLATLALTALPAHATTAWQETAQGDLSNNSAAPTFVGMAAGANTVGGLTGVPGSGVAGIDRDYFSFSVPTGQQLSAILVNPATYVSGSVSFIGIERGTQVTAGGSRLLGYSHYGPETVGTNLLPQMLAAGTSVLGSGSYSVWLQETGGTVEYSFDFLLTPVPEPATGLMLGAGLLALGRRLSARRR